MDGRVRAGSRPASSAGHPAQRGAGRRVDGFGYFPKEESNPRGGSRTEQGNLAETRAKARSFAMLSKADADGTAGADDTAGACADEVRDGRAVSIGLRAQPEGSRRGD